MYEDLSNTSKCLEHSDSSGHVLQLRFRPFQGRVDKIEGAEGIYAFVDFERGSQRCPSKCYSAAKLLWDLKSFVVGTLVLFASQNSDFELAVACLENVARLWLSALIKS